MRTSTSESPPKKTDVRIVGVELYFLPVQTRVPLKFGTETLTSVTCARARVVVEDRLGRTASGWGETPLNVQWVWPSQLNYSVRHQRLCDFCQQLAATWSQFHAQGHPLEIGHDFQAHRLPQELAQSNEHSDHSEEMPILIGRGSTRPIFSRYRPKKSYPFGIMQLMVQDLTNPMLAQIPHVLLAAHAETIMGVESNGMQFYPSASEPEAEIHPGLYQRRNGQNKSQPG